MTSLATDAGVFAATKGAEELLKEFADHAQTATARVIHFIGDVVKAAPIHFAAEETIKKIALEKTLTPLLLAVAKAVGISGSLLTTTATFAGPIATTAFTLAVAYFGEKRMEQVANWLRKKMATFNKVRRHAAQQKVLGSVGLKISAVGVAASLATLSSISPPKDTQAFQDDSTTARAGAETSAIAAPPISSPRAKPAAVVVARDLRRSAAAEPVPSAWDKPYRIQSIVIKASYLKL